MFPLTVSSFRRRPESGFNPSCEASKINDVSFGRILGLDSSLLKAEHVHMLSTRAGFRRNDERGVSKYR